ncbi:MAG: hypothetical protein AAFY35_16550 [Pseudomonadota bacterium]
MTQVIDLYTYEDGGVSVTVWANDFRDAGWEAAVLPTMSEAIKFAKKYAQIHGAEIHGAEILEFPIQGGAT